MNQNHNVKRAFILSALVVLFVALAVLGMTRLVYKSEQANVRMNTCLNPEVKVTPQLDDVFAIEATGTIYAPSGDIAIGGEAPGLVIVSGNETYQLTFNTNQSLATDAYKHVGECVKVTGVLTKTGGVELPARSAIDAETLMPAK